MKKLRRLLKEIILIYKAKMEFFNKNYNSLKLLLILTFIVCYMLINRYKLEHTGTGSRIIKIDMFTGRSYYSNGGNEWIEMK